MARPRPAPPVELFARLPGGFVAAWQADWAALRRSALVGQALKRASSLPIDPAHLDRLGRAEWIAGVLLPGGRSVVAMEGPELSYVSAPGSGSASSQLAALEPPSGHDFWLVLDPRASEPLTIGPVKGVTVQFPLEIVRSARRIVAHGNAGTLSLEVAAEAEYASVAEAARLASSLNGFLGLVRRLSVQTRNAAADEALKLFWDSLEVRAEGNRVLTRARLNEVSLARLLVIAGP